MNRKSALHAAPTRATCQSHAPATPSHPFPLPGTPWALASPGAAWHAGRQLAVIADLHLGYEYARGARGDVVPRHSLAETQARLATLLDHLPIRDLVVAGDLCESAATCRQTDLDRLALEQWLNTRGVRWILIRGNHDPDHLDMLDDLTVDGWTITHGHHPHPAPRQILGHWHPALKLGTHTAGCFLWNPSRILLPAFSPNAAGLDVRALSLPADWQPHDLRCALWAEPDWLDFGPLQTLTTSLRNPALPAR